MGTVSVSGLPPYTVLPWMRVGWWTPSIGFSYIRTARDAVFSSSLRWPADMEPADPAPSNAGCFGKTREQRPAAALQRTNVVPGERLKKAELWSWKKQ